MRTLRLPVLLAALLTLAVGPAALAQSAPPRLSVDAGPGPVVRVHLDGMVDNALAQYVKRAVADAEADSAAVLVLQMNTYGGLLDAGDAIRTTLLNASVPVVAVVDPNAASAGALIAYAADRIVMVPGANMGAATAVDQTGEAAPEKIQSYTRGLMRATAEATGRDPRIAEAMVDDRIAIPGVTRAGELLTLSSTEALRLGIADAVLPSVDATVEALGLADRPQVDHRASWAEGVLRFLGSPVLASILMMMMLGGLYFELQSPGVGFAGAAAVVGAALFFAPHYLLGLVQSWEIALFLVGMALIALEVFVIPGFGVFGIGGIAMVVTALLIALVPNVGLDFPSEGEIARASATVATSLVLLILLAGSLARWLPSSTRFSHLILAGTMDATAGYTSADTDDALLGANGTAVTPLRPAGTALLGDRRVDVVSDGPMLDAGTPIEVVSVRGARVVVRAAPGAVS